MTEKAGVLKWKQWRNEQIAYIIKMRGPEGSRAKMDPDYLERED